MRTISKHIVESVFSSQELEELMGVYNKEQQEYIDRLQEDDFAYDYSQDEVSSWLQKKLLTCSDDSYDNDMYMVSRFLPVVMNYCRESF